jgi:hypothetical protein
MEKVCELRARARSASNAGPKTFAMTQFKDAFCAKPFFISRSEMSTYALAASSAC